MDLLSTLQNFQSKRGVNLIQLEKGGLPLGTIRELDGVDCKKVADTGGKGDWVVINDPNNHPKVHMDINRFNQFHQMLQTPDFEGRYLKTKEQFVNGLKTIYHENDVETLIHKDKNKDARVHGVWGRVFKDNSGVPEIPEKIRKHLEATGLKLPAPPSAPKETVDKSYIRDKDDLLNRIDALQKFDSGYGSIDPNKVFIAKSKDKTKDYNDFIKFFERSLNKKYDKINLDHRNKLWEEGSELNPKIKEISLDKIIPGQFSLNLNKLEKLLSTDVDSKDLSLAIEIPNSDKFILFDGHHRIAKSILKGDKKGDFKVVWGYRLFKQYQDK